MDTSQLLHRATAALPLALLREGLRWASGTSRAMGSGSSAGVTHKCGCSCGRGRRRSRRRSYRREFGCGCRRRRLRRARELEDVRLLRDET